MEGYGSGARQEQSGGFLRRCGLPPKLGRLVSGGSSVLKQRFPFPFLSTLENSCLISSLVLGVN